MHRSGTSALAGVLSHLGATAPRTLLPPAVDNPLGFWESAPFRAFHDRLLDAGGAEWDLWAACHLSRIPRKEWVGLDRDFSTLFDQEFGNARLSVIKDPRMCLVVPYWLRHLRAREADSTAILALRHPFEVAASVVARDGTTKEHALLVWLRYVLESEASTREVPRAFVQYEELLTDWRAVATRLGRTFDIEWPAWDEDADRAIDAFVRPAMRHHRGTLDASDVEGPLAQWVGETWNAMRQLRANVDDAATAQAVLDAVRHELDRVSPISDRMVKRERDRQRATAGEREVIAGKARHDRERVVAMEWERDQLTERLSFIEAEFDRLRVFTDGVQADANRSWAEVTRLTSERDALRVLLDATSRRADDADCRAAALSRSLTWRWTAPLRVIGDRWMRLRTRMRASVASSSLDDRRNVTTFEE